MLQTLIESIKRFAEPPGSAGLFVVIVLVLALGAMICFVLEFY